MKSKDYFDEDPPFLTVEGTQVRICFDIEHTQEEQNPFGTPIMVDVIKAYCCRVDQPLTYESVASSMIRDFFSVDEEFSIQRQKDDKATDYNTYNAWVEKLKYIARRVVEGDNLETIKGMKLAELGLYDASDAVDSFSVGGVSMWLGPDRRGNLKNAVEALKAQGVETVVFAGQTIPADDALAMLSAIESYAAVTSMVTDGHKAAINALETEEAVAAYDFTVGYPAKLEF